MLSYVSGERIKVISTDERSLLPNKTGVLEIANSSLDYKEFTVCARFKTFRFTIHHDPAIHPYQGILSK